MKLLLALFRHTLHSAMVATYLFACVHNAGRSQMAAAWFNHLVDPTEALAVSAGTQPDDHVHPEVVNAMAEIGIDLSGATPRKLTEELARGANLLVTMGCSMFFFASFCILALYAASEVEKWQNRNGSDCVVDMSRAHFTYL